MIKWSNATMIRSLLVNLAMLAGTLAAVFWIGWSVPQIPPEDFRRVVGEVTPNPPAAVRSPEVVVPAGPTRTGPDAKLESSAPRGKAEKRLDLNRATVEQFQKLPGIGPTLAQRMFDHRRASGPFRSVDDLRKVKGIGQKRLARLRPLVMVEAAGQPTEARRGTL
jgi:competence ComEA-like helix-hairpin-helix protein